MIGESPEGLDDAMQPNEPGPIHPSVPPPVFRSRSESGTAARRGTIPCPYCNQPIDAEDAYCRHCGRAQAAKAPWYYHPVFILVIALTVLGPFALPLVWRSPMMTPGGKWSLALVIIAYTILVLYITYVIFMYMYQHYMELFRMQGII